MLGERRPRVTAADGTNAGAGVSPDAAPAPRGAWRDPVTAAVAAAAFGAYFALSLFRLLQLNPGSWDLGMYTEYVKQLSLLRAPVV
ncbi:MAG: hypothetical protein QOG28_3266, partial [Trebonia sp.]|nr:hypothetical protein [Trebonia sp.]